MKFFCMWTIDSGGYVADGDGENSFWAEVSSKSEAEALKWAIEHKIGMNEILVSFIIVEGIILFEQSGL